jgi:tripartite-type tricarboxylate transporter receptor subunit TctC
MRRRKLLHSLAVLCTLAAFGPGAAAQAAGTAYPDRPLRLIIGQAAGGAVDTVARMMAERQYLKNGRVKAIAVAMRERSALMPEVPTFDEAGLKGFEFAPCVGVVAPAGLPPAVSTRLAAALATVMADADTGKRLRDIGFVSFGGNGAEFASLVKREVERYRVLVRQRDIKLED